MKVCSTPGVAATNVPGPPTLARPADLELDLALEHVERVGVIVVDVQVGTVKARLERELDHG